ncbi:MAG TPA: PfkB family carbohydrate kinase [Methylococcus sp.]|nr:PfkB family carbohydrate kinase [Methylococcus sp.]
MLFGELLADCFPDHEAIGGAPFNVARHLQAFGARPRLISRIGKDALGERLLELLQRMGLDVSGIQHDDSRPTGRVRVHIDRHGHSFEILPNQAYDYIDADAARTATVGFRPRLVYFGTLVQRHPVSRNALRAVLASTAAPRILDLNLRPPWCDADIVRASLRQADIVKSNAEELGQVARLLDLPEGNERWTVQALLDRVSLRFALVTAAEAGAWLQGSDGTEFRLAGRTGVKVVDTVGAGDAFTAVFLLGLLRHWPPPLFLERADAFARAICGIRGAVPLGDDFYVPFRTAWGLSSE